MSEIRYCAVTPPLRVLVVDADVDRAASFSRMLNLLSCHSAVACGHFMACRVAPLFRPELVFVDLDMGEVAAQAVCVALKALAPPGRGARTLGLAPRQRGERAMALGFDQLLEKPLEPGALGAVLNDAKLHATACRYLYEAPCQQLALDRRQI